MGAALLRIEPNGRAHDPSGVKLRSLNSLGEFVESVPTTDFHTFYGHATRLSTGEFVELFKTKSPPTVGYYAVFHWLLGPSYATNYIGSAAAWTGGAAFVYRALQPFVDDEQKARFVCFTLALCPTFFAFSPVISSESVFYLLSAICTWLVARHLIGGGPFPYLYVAVGLVTAALFLTRTNGLLALVVCLFTIGIGRDMFPREAGWNPTEPETRRSRHPLVLCVIVFLSFVLVWFSHAQLSWMSGQRFQVTASPYGSWNLLVGTNFDANGRNNRQDLELAGYRGENQLPWAEANEKAREIAMERITSDPVRFARFALTAKLGELWNRERALYDSAAGSWERGEKVVEMNPKVMSLVFASLDGVYRFTLLLFLILLIREIRRPTVLLALGAILILFSLPHIFMEVKPRYHLAMSPFIIVASMLLVLDFEGLRTEWLSTARSKMKRWLD